MFIRKLDGKGSAISGLFLSYHSWHVGLPKFDIRNLKSPLGGPANWRFSADLISEAILSKLASDIVPLPFTARLKYALTASSAGWFIPLYSF